MFFFLKSIGYFGIGVGDRVFKEIVTGIFFWGLYLIAFR